ncbi:UNKNOWN [Stylonychia lemnae]|uniref:Uncharacterized protein n=1 Tax=Stylonychia lemnae TaxID=5949 RepID=A0A078B224_STYLE|nr:UNKNOWN [Stylonychia lemnae]|eukprot:CDW87418.1 UNKNOWN [Stylonychia lemnae]
MQSSEDKKQDDSLKRKNSLSPPKLESYLNNSINLKKMMRFRNRILIDHQVRTRNKSNIDQPKFNTFANDLLDQKKLQVLDNQAINIENSKIEQLNKTFQSSRRQRKSPISVQRQIIRQNPKNSVLILTESQNKNRNLLDFRTNHLESEDSKNQELQIINQLTSHYNNFNATTDFTDFPKTQKVSNISGRFKRNKSVNKSSKNDNWRNMLLQDLNNSRESLNQSNLSHSLAQSKIVVDNQKNNLKIIRLLSNLNKANKSKSKDQFSQHLSETKSLGFRRQKMIKLEKPKIIYDKKKFEDLMTFNCKKQISDLEQQIQKLRKMGQTVKEQTIQIFSLSLKKKYQLDKLNTKDMPESINLTDEPQLSSKKNVSFYLPKIDTS